MGVHRFLKLSLAVVTWAMAPLAMSNPYPDPVGPRAKVEATDRAFDVPTFLDAVDFDRLYLVSLFLDAGMDIDARDESYGNTALHAAAAGGRVETVRLLIARGADVDALNKELSTPLHTAVTNADLTVVQALLDAGARSDLANERGALPIHNALTRNAAPMIEVLLNAGADIEAADGAGRSPLMMAAYGNAIAPMELLVGRGARVNASGSGRNAGETPLTIAVRRTNLAAVDALLRLGADPDIPGPAGLTPLHVSVTKQHTDLVRRLMRSGADPMVVNADGKSALALAVERGNPVIVDALLKHPAFAAAPPSRQHVVLEAAVRRGSARILKRLLAEIGAGSAVDALLLAAIGTNRAHVVRLLLDAGAAVNRPDAPRGRTPLMHAVERYAHDIVGLLLAFDADVSARDADGVSALELALHDARSDMVAALLAHGADPDQTMRTGQSALMLAVSKGDVSSVQALLAAGAATGAGSNDGHDPAEYAAREGLLLIGELLARYAQARG